MKLTTLLMMAGGLCVALPAAAQPRAKSTAFLGGGGASSGGGIKHFSATGVGMAVGSNSGGGLSARHGFLAGTSRGQDDTPPTIVPLDDIRQSTVADRCVAVIDLPPVQVTDDRDRAPRVTVTLQTVPPQDIDPAGQEVELAPGSYDVLIVAIDRYDNESRETYRVDVFDGARPVIQLAQEPTPVGGEAQAVSPAGTQVPIAFNCVDACDPDATGSRAPLLARYPLGDTRVTLACEDASGNDVVRDITVRVRDTAGPTLAGVMPDAITRECNSPDGAEVEVPALVWQDNGYNAADLSITLVLDPGTAFEQAYDPIPDQLSLLRGPHVLRYVAEDPQGNVTTADLNVLVEDNGVPVLRVIDAPANGWFAGNEAVVVFEAADGCGRAGQGLAIDVVPPPVDQTINGGIVTVRYRDEGIYALTITLVDDDGNETTDNSIAFGIDRAAPAPVVSSPSQAGVDPDDESTWPIFAQAEALGVNFGGEEEADGTFSGMARVQVVLDPNGAAMPLADREYASVGEPPRGNRVEGNVGCEADDPSCNDALALELRHLPIGPHEVAITVTDFAGNQTASQARFRSMDLYEGFAHLRGLSEAILLNNPAAAVRVRVQRARQAFISGRDVGGVRIAASPYRTQTFLGTALRFVQSATTDLAGAINASNGAEQADLIELTSLLHRLALSDLQLMAEHVRGLPAELDAVVVANRAVDLNLAIQAMDLMGQDIAAERWSQSADNALQAFFHLKSAVEGWMMDYEYVPNLADDVAILDEYRRGLNILTGIRDELSLYLTLESKPAEDNAQLIRDRLNPIIQDLDLLARRGFDGNGLSDHDYTVSLLELRDVANFSTLASNQGAHMRNYQFAMIQVVRYMTQTSMEDAIYWRGGGRRNWPIYSTGLGYVADGVDLLDQRRVQEVIDLYGTEQDPLCLVVAVYHCDFLDDDEGDLDTDEPLPVADVPAFCWDRMYQPPEWAGAAPDGLIPPQCVYGNVQR